MTPRKGSPYIRDRRVALIAGYGGILLGALSLWDAYENRGHRRPFATKFLPGA